MILWIYMLCIDFVVLSICMVMAINFVCAVALLSNLYHNYFVNIDLQLCKLLFLHWICQNVLPRLWQRYIFHWNVYNLQTWLSLICENYMMRCILYELGISQGPEATGLPLQSKGLVDHWSINTVKHLVSTEYQGTILLLCSSVLISVIIFLRKSSDLRLGLNQWR